MLPWLKKHYKITALGLGALAVLGLPPYYIWPILFLCFSWFILLLNQRQTWRQAFALGYWFGFGFFSLGLSWIGNALLIEAATFGWLYPIVLLTTGVFFGLFVAFPAALSFYFKGLGSKIWAMASWWVIFEWIRSFFLTGFPWNLLGTSLAFSPVTIQLAAVGGTYLLSFLVLIIAMMPALWLNDKSRKNFIIAVATITIIIGTTLGFGYTRTHRLYNNIASEHLVRIVQPSIPQAMKWNRETLEKNFQKYIEMSQIEGLEKVTFTIWGETASPFPLDLDDKHRLMATAAIAEGGYLITGALGYSFDKYGEPSPLNAMMMINKSGEIVANYNKSHLVPFGEYIPLRKYLPSYIRPITNTIADFKSGNGPETISIANLPKLGAVICYEIIFPTAVVDKENRPEWLINFTNDGWYGDSAGPHQHLVATQMRAVEEGITIIRVANSGISAIISRTGGVINKIDLNTSGILDVALPQKLNIDTLYGKFGNYIPLILCFLNIIAIFFLTKHKR